MKPESMMIDGVKYVREDVVQPVEIGEKRIIASDKGWVFVGDCVHEEDGKMVIYNALNIRRWGTTEGLGQLRNGPTEETVTDYYGTVRVYPVMELAVEGGW